MSGAATALVMWGARTCNEHLVPQPDGTRPEGSTDVLVLGPVHVLVAAPRVVDEDVEAALLRPDPSDRRYHTD